MDEAWSDDDIYSAIPLETYLYTDENTFTNDSPIIDSNGNQATSYQPMEGVSGTDVSEKEIKFGEQSTRNQALNQRVSVRDDEATEQTTAANIMLQSENTVDLEEKVLSIDIEVYHQDSSDDNIPLIEVQRRLFSKSKMNNSSSIIESPVSSDLDNSDMDITYLPSDATSNSDIAIGPVMMEAKRKKKWLRKRVRPLKREERRKQNKFIQPKKHVKRLYDNTDSNELNDALKKSKAENDLQSMQSRFAVARITNLLSSNGLERKVIEADGNCFFNAVSYQLNAGISDEELRKYICKHLKENEEHYTCYLSKSESTANLVIADEYVKMVGELEHDGVWNNQLSDILPLATSNFLKTNITIYTSQLNNPVINITPDLIKGNIEPSNDLKLAYLALRGYEHYDACIPTLETGTDPSDPSNIPSALTDASQINCPTPRKRADYVSPKKTKKTRKRTPNVDQWKKNIRKHNRNIGQSYLSTSSKIINKKNVRPSNCRNCKNKCDEKIGGIARQRIFDLYYDANMTYERKRDFVCQHIEICEVSSRYKRTYKQETRKYSLPVGNEQFRVCKQFFLRTLCISDKLVRCALKRKKNGMYVGTDQRGKHKPGNKTDDLRLEHVKTHIDSFPVVESHYRRKDTERKYLNQDLTVRKMHELYKKKCEEDGVRPVTEKVYRHVFCTEYNLSFHKPKKDVCQTCNTYKELKKTGQSTKENDISFNEHIQRKEIARKEKEMDKKKSKLDQSIYTATFDLQAVLQTPCSNVSQTYYKRKLNSYNLTFYSLADGKGTCYVWNETHGLRGSSEIGTCVLTHINSLPSTVKHVILYSDCCSGQNRNKYLASGLLHTVCRHPTVEVIEQKFLESGHTQMECDSMHSAIEHAKKRTSLFVPEQWDTIFQMARRQKPYQIVPMRNESFYDLKKLSSDNYTNFKIDTEGNKINWMKIKVLKVEKASPDKIFVQYNYDKTELMTVIVNRNLKRGRPVEVEMTKKYKGKLPISLAKKSDLLDLCKALIIPEIYWPFYQKLLTNSKVRDKLPCPDILDAASDSDNND